MELSIWQEYQDEEFIIIGVGHESVPELIDFVEDQGITYPILHDDAGVYGDYNLQGGPSPYPRDFIIDQQGIIRYANTEYDPGGMVVTIEHLLGGGSAQFIRGDADGDSTINMSDAVFTLRHLYIPGSETPPCMKAADTDDTGAIAMSDAMYLMRYLYVPGSPEPPIPFTDCGSDPTYDELGCGSHPCQMGN
jgi:hypothetical protein